MSLIDFLLKNRPPGTGKTFIGVKLVQFLMNNKKLWWNRPGDHHRPILMVCYTNHALDQFLENCIKQCGLTDGVVRVGGQSRSENLDNFKLANIKRERQSSSRTLRNLDCIHRKANNKRRELLLRKERILFVSELINCVKYRDGLLHFRFLEKFIDKNCLEYFKSGVRGPNYTLLEWLGFFDDELELLRLVENVRHEESQVDDGLGISGLFSSMNLNRKIPKLNFLNENGNKTLKKRKN